eukprot:m.241322 g.241322  ORF g.241322 m.241322 type:complete len:279 (+) comp26308_c0_seq2:2769-3605(+)
MFDVDAVPQTILVEAAEFGDILIVHPSRSSPSEHPFSLLPKVLQFFRWATDACVSATHILKTNEHSFVHVSRLQAELESVAMISSTGLVYGRIMRRQRAGKTDRENLHNLVEWPPYPSGSGYVVTRDIGKFLGTFAADVSLRYEFEDRAVGLLLAGYAAKTVTKGFGTHLELRNGQDQFRPWGHCTPETLVLHYQSHDRLLRRRFERARRGEPLCGEGFAPHDVCVRAEFHKPATFRMAVYLTRCPLQRSRGRINSSGQGTRGVRKVPRHTKLTTTAD